MWWMGRLVWQLRKGVSMGSEEIGLRAINTNLTYFTLRKIIGWSGLLLPWLVWLIAWSYQPSISDYYYTRSGILFTSLLTLVGAFLISYRGYDRKTEKVSDNIITWVGGILIIIVALVPTPFEWASCYCPTPICHNSTLWGFIHFGSAAGFFACMGYLSIYRFTKGDEPFEKDKRRRNRIYRTCGIGMWVILGIAGILIFIFDISEEFSHFVFWVEVVLLILFGTSWLVKGKGLVDLGIQKDDEVSTEPTNQEKGPNDSKNQNTEGLADGWELNNSIGWLVGSFFVILLIIYLGFDQLLKTELISWDNYNNKWGIGEFVNGITAPFIGLVGAYLVFISFKSQVRANKIQFDELKTQRRESHRDRFEAKFHEMLRQHNANVGEMEIKNDRHHLKGRKLLMRMFLEYKFVFKVFEEVANDDFEGIFKDEDLIRLSYLVFFHGVDIDSKRTLNPEGNPIIKELFDKVSDHLLNTVRIEYRDRVRDKKNLDDPIGRLPSEDESDSDGFKILYHPFDGHTSRLPHYYRHLFQIVSLIVDEKDLKLSEKEKYSYIKMIRSQLSNFEQLLLYYNSFVYGKPWVENKYFTRYRIIKNLPLVHADFGVKPHDKLGIKNEEGQFIFEDDEYQEKNKQK